MVLTLLIIARKIFGLEHLLHIRHLENMNKFILATGTMVGYAYANGILLWHGTQEINMKLLHLLTVHLGLMLGHIG